MSKVPGVHLVRRLVRAVCVRWLGRQSELLYVHVGRPSHFEWADWLRRHHGFSIGEGTTVNPLMRFTDDNTVTIGRNCSLSWCDLITHSGGDRILRQRWSIQADSTRPIFIGDNCMIGAGAQIMPGVTIGDDCVIGAGACIRHDVPPGRVMVPPEAADAGPTLVYALRLHDRATGRLSATRSAS